MSEGSAKRKKLLRRLREHHAEGRAPSHLALDRYLGSVRGGDGLDDGEPEPGAVVRQLPRVVGAEELLEQRGLRLLWNADTGIGNAKLDPILPLLDPQLHVSPRPACT